MLLVPQDELLTTLMERGTEALAQAGVTVEELLADVPAAREKVMREAYGAEFMDALAHKHAAIAGGQTNVQRGAEDSALLTPGTR